MSEDVVMMMEREAGAPDQVPALGVGFFGRPVQDAKESKKAGHPVFKDRDWVRIVVPGDRNAVVERPASDTDKRRFPRAFAAYKAIEQKAALNGFPIEEWPQVTRAMAMTLKAAHVYTVESLAELSDAHIGKLGFAVQELKSKAQAFLLVSKDTAAAQQFKAESDRKDAAIADLQRQISELAGKLEKRGPGRPANVNAP